MNAKLGTILIVDDNEDILFSLELLLKTSAEKIITLNKPDRIINILKNETIDVILLDMNFSDDTISGKEGFYWLEKILEQDPEAVVLFITAYGGVDQAVKAVHAGATDFVLKPWKNEKLMTTIESASKLRKTRREARQLKEKQSELINVTNSSFHDLIGVSDEMNTVFSTIKKVAGTDANILILGENGTGKELVARALHKASARVDEIFVNVDLGAISETLFESELFGHVKGAFTDAKKDRIGRFELASEGTIFLDEIGNLSLPLQSKLLHVLENGKIVRVGSNKQIPVNVRFICATNMPLYKMVQENTFRQDLLYRINTVEVNLPPLRERREDIKLLAEHFLQQFARKYKKNIRKVSKKAIHVLEEYSWPGNIRELRHSIERAVILSDSDQLNETDFHLTHAVESVDNHIMSYNLEEVEKQTIKKVIRKYKGNVTKAARELGLTRTSLYRRLEKYGL